jgi:hypothetical protein
VVLVRLLWLALPRDDVGTTARRRARPQRWPPNRSRSGICSAIRKASTAQFSAQRAPTTVKLTLPCAARWRWPIAKAGHRDDRRRTRHERGYNVGERRGQRAKLSEIYTDRFVLSHEGATETLHLPPGSACMRRNLPRGVANRQRPSRQGQVSAANVRAAADGARRLDWNQAQKHLQIDPVDWPSRCMSSRCSEIAGDRRRAPVGGGRSAR